ncbi:MAG: SCP2 sterol-binding domain-containing protein, partial [Candidatus Heimdallarchaeota archaeon]|nr:SCP2 sterol-binding domain-containing protein [Candidatus Heimdallarchaeota archaeon]MCK5144864.1 SCP2 sterol-binding domain-containing protein [Candidatus Heimdallarchaeota archaeon]
MKKRTKRILIGIGIALGVIIASGGGFILYLKLGFRPQVFSLDDAPQEILDIQDDLVAKLDGGTFDWSDMPDFVIFSQYISDNSPLVKKLVKNWEEIVWFNITDQEYLWFIIENDSLIFNIGPTPPGTYGILITLDFAEMVRIIHRDVTPQNSFMQGGLKFEGNFNDVLTVNQIVETAAATLMGSFAPPIDVSGNFHITVDNPDLYNEDGLTLIPYITINLEPGHLGELHVATPSTGKAIIVNNRGEMVAELEGSA